MLSQTVPLIALAPLVVSWGGKLHLGGFEWPRWLSAAVLGAFLAFFPVAVGTLKGLTSTPPASLELMDSYAASWRQTLFKLRFPAAVPYIVPALKLAATASVVGVVVAEISTGLARRHRPADHRVRPRGDERPGQGVTRRCSARRPSGSLMAGLVALIDLVAMRNRPTRGDRVTDAAANGSNAVEVRGLSQGVQRGHGRTQVEALVDIDLDRSSRASSSR